MAGQQDQEDAVFQHLRESGYSEEEAAMAAAEAMGTANLGVPGGEMQDQPGPYEVKQLIPLAGAGLGGFGARALASKVLPAAAARYLPGPAVSALGQFAGAFAGNRAIGMPTGRAAESAGYAGLIGGGAESLFNVLGRGTGAMAGISKETINETLRRNPVAAAKLALGAPARDAELSAAGDLRSAFYPAQPKPGDVNLKYMTPAKNRALAKMRAFDNRAAAVPSAASASAHPLSIEGFSEPKIAALPPYEQNYPATLEGIERQRRGAIMNAMQSGQKLPLEVFKGHPDLLHQQEAVISTEPIRQKILGMVKSGSLEPSQQAVNGMLVDKAKNLPSGMTAKELDQFITEHNKPLQKMYGTDQDAALAQARKGIIGTARQVRAKAIPEAQSDYAQAAKQLQAMRDARKIALDRNGAVKPAAIGKIKGILNDQFTRDAMQKYADVTNKNFLPAWDELAMKREWTNSDRGAAGRLIYMAEKYLARPAAKFFTVGSQPAGATAAATSAFMQAMQSTQMERDIEQAKRPNP